MKPATTSGFGLCPAGTARRRLEAIRGLPLEVAARLEQADLGPEAAFLCWQLCEYAVGLDERERARLAEVVAELLIAVEQGSTRCRIPDSETALLLERAEAIVGGPGAHKPLVLELDSPGASGGFLYPQRFFGAEARVARAVNARRSAPPPLSAPEPAGGERAAIARAVAAIATTSVPPLSPDQSEAVQAALTRSLTLVTGGPGSGKTTVVLALLRAFVALGGDPTTIALCAPTGKAANRLQESIRAGLDRLAVGSGEQMAWARVLRPSTLHRLLGYSPSRRAFAYHERSLLPHRLVVVDEGSMVDLALMDRLFAAVAPEGRLVLLGDADQLPSVEAGAVFRDLFAAGVAVRLGKSHRQDERDPAGQRILAAASRIQNGDPELLAMVSVRKTPQEVAFAGVERLEREGLSALLDRWYREQIATAAGLEHVRRTTLGLVDGRFAPEDEAHLDRLFEHHQRRRCLAVTRGRPTGAMALNAALHQRFVEGDGGPESSASAFRPSAKGAVAVPGEPVLMLRNDYDRALWNGDQGLVVRVREPGRHARTAAAFKVGGRWVPFGLESLQEDLALGFATTVHKAQGSEHEQVLLVLPDAPIPLATRELLYTAVTRGRRSVVLCGSAAVLEAALARRTERTSGIAARLQAAIVR